jgi:hypothetical protein
MNFLTAFHQIYSAQQFDTAEKQGDAPALA